MIWLKNHKHCKRSKDSKSPIVILHAKGAVFKFNGVVQVVVKAKIFHTKQNSDFQIFLDNKQKNLLFFHKFYKNFSFENCRVRIFISAFDRYITFFYNNWRQKNKHSFPLYKLNGRSLNCYFLVWFVSMFKWNLPLKDF